MELSLLLQTVDVLLPEAQKRERMQGLAQHINHLINHDFNRLVQLLYTLDVDEQKLKKALHQKPDQDAALLIAHLIWTRAEEKARARQQFSKPAPHGDDERW